MYLKKSKQQIASDAASRARNLITSQLHQHNNGNLGGIGHSIANAVEDGIREAISSMMEDIYTDAEFEKDIGLTKQD